MDKSVFLFDKSKYTQAEIDKLTWKDCEEWIAEEDYEDNYTIVKIDANQYRSALDAIVSEGFEDIAEDSIIKSFGF